jgi:hypothetical protein
MRVKALVTTMTVAALLALAPGSALARTSVAGDPGNVVRSFGLLDDRREDPRVHRDRGACDGG